MVLVLLFAMLSSLAGAQTANDLSFISCWPENQDPKPILRSFVSPTSISETGWRAYASVTAEGENLSCHNATALYIAKPDSAFAPVFRAVPKGTQDGNGIRIVGWSPSGNKLLAEATDWAYGSDAGLNRTVLIYDAARGLRTVDIDKSLNERFGRECLFDYTVVRWESESTILLSVLPLHENLEERPPCVTRQTTFVYDIENGSMRSEP
jgi:hypothetical protein